MIILIRRRHVLAAGLFCCFMLGLGAVLWRGNRAFTAAFSPDGAALPRTVVIDPGHGGVDGGAVAGDGTVESRLNLEIALRVEDLLRFAGQETVMTRREDVSIHSGTARTIREKKVSDLENRAGLVNRLERAALLSIHQNSLPSSPSTHGAQVFWNAGAEGLASSIQEALNQGVNSPSAKDPKEAGSSIYLMKAVTAPAALVECGFLSNGEEAARLREPAYQLRLAAAIGAGYLAWEGR